MPTLVTDCPRCFAKGQDFTAGSFLPTHISENTTHHFEAFCMCGNCNKGTLFQLRQKGTEQGEIFKSVKALAGYKGDLNKILEIEGFINIQVIAATNPPQFLPEEIETAFIEGSQSFADKSADIAIERFMTCLDMATKGMVPGDIIRDEAVQNGGIGTTLANRMMWMFDQGMLPAGLKDLAECLTKGEPEGAGDILELTYMVLEWIYSEPARLEIAQQQQGTTTEDIKIAG